MLDLDNEFTPERFGLLNDVLVPVVLTFPIPLEVPDCLEFTVDRIELTVDALLREPLIEVYRFPEILEEYPPPIVAEAAVLVPPKRSIPLLFAVLRLFASLLLEFVFRFRPPQLL